MKIFDFLNADAILVTVSNECECIPAACPWPGITSQPLHDIMKAKPVAFSRLTRKVQQHHYAFALQTSAQRDFAPLFKQTKA